MPQTRHSVLDEAEARAVIAKRKDVEANAALADAEDAYREARDHKVVTAAAVKLMQEEATRLRAAADRLKGPE